ncbi:bifunctional 4-hydroxy-2-oxoglutarate aldolase/2-dehydro-3-deoxy-phosphogluconate aldolase [Companilactobacillus alimentarius]|uniref:Bifunctional 2-keto-4-hydroxyglutarate aldolase/2-keto-3-deoxy-6-phosphogluconate aldolase n=1 Tax=Companilactobacillus alimentarius DSM 20249 TaxID=1423720 RepID=A0A2K9HHJ6_9LACO|nr:bifunctional 2-keto-4-hydroxyglutarate aldolase/2-keto-3-deoxy-6-phosphogluconate aldolase [Companilactobacillus alimentarius]AUI72021.1 bifunctional 2-keto-4-hydroxyglutarate aldolase/2-keto-3-deoxy-6-phosphogluconate aldolase [Companilactobacillus alimentarius DSM 20249]KRK77974.1 2-dehydro-3-deoxyphosphogluconate aldolase [Companilactobacillus alimentarius DSM 20249]MDT6952556.1 bifunctional 2-keto-4-hydroxyglutarate aldolase/2-keto-3-deoxy-6-phosphogluconate aldolase [Companilactobacillus
MTLQKFNYLNKVVEAGVVSVVRGSTKEEAYKTAEACIIGGVKAIELTFTAPHADEIIGELTEKYATDDEVVIGAGTVLDPATARIAIIAGAQFIVSPSFNKEVSKLCNLYSIPYVPGCMTPNDIQDALTYGSDVIKLFPGSVVGQGMVSAVHGPFPKVNLMITGGVNLENMKDWFDKGATVLGAGSNLTGAAVNGDFDKVTDTAKKYHEEIRRIKSKN